MRPRCGMARERGNAGRQAPVRRMVVVVLAGLTITACAPEPDRPLDATGERAVRDSVSRLMASIPVGLASDGPSAWLRFLEPGPSFFMASDGRVAFPGIDSAQVFLKTFSSTVGAMELVWEGIRIEPLGSGLATVGAAYHESITDTAGVTVSFDGFMTAVARRGPDGWRLQSLHWSSPVPSAR